MKKLLIGICLFLSTTTQACNNDIECGIGNVCVKAENSIILQGTCATPTDEFGQKDYEALEKFDNDTNEPHKVVGCQFNTDCDIGFSCMKKAGELSGICMK